MERASRHSSMTRSLLKFGSCICLFRVMLDLPIAHPICNELQLLRVNMFLAHPLDRKIPESAFLLFKLQPFQERTPALILPSLQAPADSGQVWAQSLVCSLKNRSMPCNPVVSRRKPEQTGFVTTLQIRHSFSTTRYFSGNLFSCLHESFRGEVHQAVSVRDRSPIRVRFHPDSIPPAVAAFDPTRCALLNTQKCLPPVFASASKDCSSTAEFVVKPLLRMYLLYHDRRNSF